MQTLQKLETNKAVYMALQSVGCVLCGRFMTSHMYVFLVGAYPVERGYVWIIEERLGPESGKEPEVSEWETGLGDSGFRS